MSSSSSTSEAFFDALTQEQEDNVQVVDDQKEPIYYELEKVGDDDGCDGDQLVADCRNTQSEGREEENDGVDEPTGTSDGVMADAKIGRGETISKAKVNVLQRAKLFEQEDKSEEKARTPVKAVKFEDMYSKGNLSACQNKGESAYNEIWVKGTAPTEEPEDETSPYDLAKPLPLETLNDCMPTDKASLHYSSSPVPMMKDPRKKDISEDCGSSFSRSVNRGVRKGAGKAFPICPLDQPNSQEYSRLYCDSGQAFTTSQRQKIVLDRGYQTLADVAPKSQETCPSSQSTGQDPMLEEDEETGDNLSLDWGSEFDDFPYQDLEDENTEPIVAPDKPLPQKPGKNKSRDQHLAMTLNRDDPSATICWPVTINPEKHPPPRLPSPTPPDLTEDQSKRRCVISLIIQSEKSYLESLERLIQVYQKPVLEYVPQRKAHIYPVFAQMREIISHHKMFQIELAEAVRLWDSEEKIGDIFTASFSKTMLINSYSVYVNNFSAAMEEIRTVQRSRQSFAEFLKRQEKQSADRLSIFGLMVKPVQRFPQFIMCLQDLIKFTPQNHPDRRALQLALTEMENLTHKLNERKRQSEQRFQARQLMQQLSRLPMQQLRAAAFDQGLLKQDDLDKKRYLLRTDTVEQVFGEFGDMKCKDRRLVLMNDRVICVKVIEKDQSGYRVERLGLKWMAKLRDLELKETAITPEMGSVIKKEPERIHIISALPDKPEEDPFHLYADLREMLHDFTALGQVAALVNTLKRSYLGYGLSEELIHEVSRDLQRMIQIKDEQLRLVNSCSVLLVDHSKSEPPHYVLQTATAAIKQDWVVDFLLAKLALDPSNKPGWDGLSASDDLELDHQPAQFMKCVSADVPRNYTKIKCAVPIFLSPESSTSCVGVQHLWVCSSTPTRGQVAILSIHNSRPALTEAFRACDCDILSAELVPGCGGTTTPEDFVFAEDTVWLATAHRQLLVFPLVGLDSVHRDPLAIVRRTVVISGLKFVDERLFMASDIGTVDVCSRNHNGAWCISTSVQLTFDPAPVKLHFVHEEDLWLTCGRSLCVLEIDSLDTRMKHDLSGACESPIDCVVRSGVGLWMAFHDSAVIKLFHAETLENLQEMSIGNFINRLRTEKLWTLSSSPEVVVTTLSASKGLLWIGTSTGLVLTLPLPRLSEGVPLYRGRPSVSLHSHRGPVRFFSQLPCGQATLEINRHSSLRSTLSQRPSRRNLERERIELEESERRRDGEKKQEMRTVEEEEEVPGASSQSVENQKVSVSGNSQSYSSSKHKAKDNSVTAPSVEASGLNATEEKREVENLQGAKGKFSSTSNLGREKISKDISNEMTPTKGSSNDLRKTSGPLSPAYSMSDLDALRQWEESAGIKTSLTNLSHPRDDTADVLMRSAGKVSRGARSSKTLSFRTELAQRIVSQTLVRSDLPGPLEVEMLYENLLEEEPGSEVKDIPDAKFLLESVAESSGVKDGLDASEKSQTGSSLASSHDYVQFTDTPEGDTNTSALSGGSERQTDTSIHSLKSGASHTRSVGGVKSMLHLSSSSLSRNESNLSSLHSMKRSNTMRQSMSRRHASTAMVVLSGGDGYFDLDMSRSMHKSEDACVLFWLYKF